MMYAHRNDDNTLFQGFIQVLLKAGLIDGSIKVFDTDTFTVGGKKVESYLADLHDLGTFTGDTEVIANGQFNESVDRSAPAFDLDIDGITILS